MPSQSAASSAGGRNPSSAASGASGSTGKNPPSAASGASGSAAPAQASAASGASGTARSASTSAASGAGGSSGSASTSAASGAGGSSGSSSSSAAAGATGTTGSATIPYRPVKPKYGDIAIVGADNWAPWTGGKPRADWSELEEPAPRTIVATQYRPTSVSSQTKSLKYRIEGLETKFTRDGDLQTFEKKVTKHLVAYGLDTITYVPSPSDPAQVVSVIDSHALFNLKEGSVLGNNIKDTEFDSYSFDNDREAKEFLMASLDPELETQLLQDCNDDDSFVAVWLTLIHIVRSESIVRFNKIKDRIKDCKLSDYSGENIESIATDFLMDFKDLHGGRMYDQSLTLTMLNTVMEAGGTSNEDFKHPLRKIRDKLKTKLMSTRHMNYDDAHAAMVTDELDARSILKQVKLEYRSLYDDGKWPAAAHTQDTKTVDKSYGRVNKAQSSQLKNLVNALVQSTTDSSKGKASKPKKGKGKYPNSSNKSARNNSKSKANGRPGSRGNGSAKRTPPPKEGEAEIKFINGVKKYWCTKCNRWTLSHGTDSHKSNEQLKAEAQATAGMSRVDFDMHPSAFMAQDRGSSWSIPSRESAFIFILEMIMWIGRGLAYTYFVGLGLSLIETYKPIVWSHLTELYAAIVNVVTVLHQEWLLVLLIVMSGIIGFGTALITFSQIRIAEEPPPKFRLRCGTAAVKQGFRHARAQTKQSPRRWKRRVPIPQVVPPADERVNKVHHPRFNNLGRQNRYEPPTLSRINYVRNRTREVGMQIFRLQKAAHLKRVKLARLKAELGLLRDTPRRSGPVLPPKPPMWRCVPKPGRPGQLAKMRLVPNQFNVKPKHMLRTTWNFKPKRQSAPDPFRAGPTVTKPDNWMFPADQKPGTPTVTKEDNWFCPADAKPEPWSPLQSVKCYIARLINLSQISSTYDSENEAGTVLFDSGANCCITNRKADFSSDFKWQVATRVIDGIGKGLKIEGHGTVAWTFKADDGMYRTLRLPCFFVPSTNTRIASLQQILTAYPKEQFHMDRQGLTLSGDGSVPSLTIPMCTNSRLPVARTLEPDSPSYQSDTQPAQPTVNRRSLRRNSTPKAVLPAVKHPSLTTASNLNLTEPEKELLRWHHRLGHVGMRRVQWLFRQGILATSEAAKRLHSSAAKLTHGPLCTACQYAKQRQKTSPGTVKQVIKEEEGALKKNDLFPGQEVSVDHFYCNPLGRLLTTYGRESADKKFMGGCIFVDHATGLVFIELQTRLNSHETLAAKQSFEQHCAEHGVIAQSYLSDNGTQFVSAKFSEHLKQFHQTIRHSGVGAHHSNGIAERTIGTVLSISRAMLHHAAIHWPDVADVELWPLAVLHAVHVVNRIPRDDTGRSPLELFSRKTWPSSKFQDFHVWGCPVYVLDSKISSGGKLPRWKPRSARGVYVGNSLKHGHAVPLILDLETGKITAQYHVVFDDEFQTVQSTAESQVNFDDEDWYQTFGLNPSQYVPDDVHDTHPPAHHAVESEGATRLEDRRHVRDHLVLDQRVGTPRSLLQREHDPDPLPLPDSKPAATHPVAPSPPVLPLQAASPPTSPLQRENSPDLTKVLPDPQQEVTTPVVKRKPGRPRKNPVPSDPQPAVKRGPGRPPKHPKPVSQSPKYVAPHKRGRGRPPKAVTDQAEPVQAPSGPATQSQEAPRRHTRSQGDNNLVEGLVKHAVAFFAWSYDLLANKSRASTDPDLYTWDQAMASPHREEFLKAARIEIDALTEKGTWYEELKCLATTKIIPSQWVFRIKRTPDGTIKKFKARIVFRGDLQEDNGQDNYSPVAAWSTVRTFLVTSIMMNWVTTTVDFSNAFVQSKLPDDEPVWMHVPRGYVSTEGPAYCLRLVKSLYGLACAQKLWFEYASKGFKQLGLRQSEHDPCLWYGDEIMLVCYVDDCGISAPSQERIDRFVNDMRELKFELTQEGSFSEFLGIKFDRLDDGSIKCSQKGLIKKTLEAAGMQDCNPNSVPATQIALGADEDGTPMDERWNYRAICGMLLYLSTNTRPDITFAVSQVCRFGQNPKKSHATAVKTILRYLKKTSNQGIIVKPANKQFDLDLYVDADFCGLFGQENARNPDSVRSRTGYIVTLCGWPIIWKSSLQSHLSQSTLEAEYSALSSSLRVYLPLKELIEEMIRKTKCKMLANARLHATVFEDNQSTYFLATNQRITSRTKYLLAKWHWFWDRYNQGKFSIVKCPTGDQLADYLTKAQPKAVFEQNRKAIQGW